MSLVTRPQLTDARLPGTLRAGGPTLSRAGSSKRRYWRAGTSIVRRGMLLVVLAVLAMIVLAARGSPLATW